jgi:hypothetical protein
MELCGTSQRLSFSFLPRFFCSAPGVPRRAVETMRERRRFADSAFSRTHRSRSSPSFHGTTLALGAVVRPRAVFDGIGRHNGRALNPDEPQKNENRSKNSVIASRPCRDWG